MFQPSEDVRVTSVETDDRAEPRIEGRSPRQLAWRRLKQDRVAMTGGLLLLVIVLVAVFASQLIHLYGHEPAEFNSALIGEDTQVPLGRFGGMSGSHWLGVEPINGRDVLSRLIAGARTSLVISSSATVISVVLGTVTGLVSAYYGGVLDAVMTLFFDMLLTIPGLLLAMALLSVLSQSPEFLGLSGEHLNFAVVIFLLGFAGFPYLGRIIRGQVLSLREKEFIEAARTLGASDLRIITRELLPNLLGPLLVWTTLTLPTYILGESALSYLGIGVQPPTSSWGGMLSDAQSFYLADPMYLFCPGGALFLTVLSFNLFGDGLRDALDPKSTQ